jgi:predicted CXXCH cytochrome family protein
MNTVKRMIFKRKIISYVAIWSIIIGSLLSYSPETHVLSAEGAPEITLITPAGDTVFDTTKVEITGKVSDDTTTPDQLVVKVFEQQSESEQLVDITNEGLLSPANQAGEFSFSKEFSAGVHTLNIAVTDNQGVSDYSSLTFTVGPNEEAEQSKATNVETENEEQTSLEVSKITQTATATAGENLASLQSLEEEISERPYVAGVYFIPKGSADKYVPSDPNDPNKQSVPLPEDYKPAEDMTRVPLDSQILIDIRSTKVFSKTQPLLTFFGDITGTDSPVTQYNLTNGITANVFTYTLDKPLESGTKYYIYFNPNLLVPEFFKFTTVSLNEEYQFPAKGRPKDIVHGSFSNVTNSCAYCHSTHQGKSPTLESRNETSGNDLCLTCHNGTMGGVPTLTDYEHTAHYSESAVSCTSCHNPHAGSTNDNPASLKHDLTYKKTSTAKGLANDFNMCLDCHNGKINEKTGKEISNIKKYYPEEPVAEESKPGHYITASADSGSQLNGQLPCAECHDTHGSKNSMMLREHLGNLQPSELNKYSTTQSNWNNVDERSFCISCHRNKTELYGTSAGNIEDDGTEGHEKLNPAGQPNTRACSECHGTGEGVERFRSAAHAPMRIEEP